MAVHSKNVCFLLMFVFLLPSSSMAHEEFIDVIANAKPSVVIIEVTRGKSKKITSVLGDDADFFEQSIVDLPNRSRGSGFIVSRSEQHLNTVSILTAAHVVHKAAKIRVLFSNGERKKAQVVWLNKKKDVALLEVNGAKKTGMALEFSNGVAQEGQYVVSIASSFDLSVSSSLGIVSALDVSLPSKKGVKLIQTDATINPGSSGGPLLNSKGKVIGLISNIYTKTGTFSGTAFAIPAHDVIKLMKKKKK